MRLVTAAIIKKNGTVLIARRGPSEKLAGYWEFPGGKVDADETLADCLIRELREELGISVVPGRTLCESDFHYEHGAFRIVAIEATAESYDFQLKVHDQVAWVLPIHLKEFALLPADIPIIEVLTGESNEKI
jgi:8-oxo-dGTP diphosphatase